jgi:NDP-sugar pyrophosphorylase family protein
MKAMVLAAGQGTRMGELTRLTPKPMLDVAGKPILGHILSNLANHGFNDVVINLFTYPEVIREHFGDGSRYGLQISYVKEEQLLGTAGSVLNARAFFESSSEPFLVHYGDVITTQNFTAMTAAHKSRKADVTLLLHRRAFSNSMVFLDTDMRVERLLERPTEAERSKAGSDCWVNSGVYLLNPSVLDSIPAQFPSDFPRDVFPALIASGKLYGHFLDGYRCAIDSPERLEQAREHLSG